MSYVSENSLSQVAKLGHIKDLLDLLGFEKVPGYSFRGTLGNYFWFDTADYRSYTGVELNLNRRDEGPIVVSTRTRSSRSYWDLSKQNQTIRLIRRHFGGHFITDFGKGRYFRPEGQPSTPSQSGCHLAFQYFGTNIIRASGVLDNRDYAGWEKTSGVPVIDSMNPRILANNLLLPYLIAVIEEYFKSTFIALLRYSDRKGTILRRGQLSAQHWVAVSEGEMTPEEAFCQRLPFQSIAAASEHFAKLEPQLDLAGALRKPYRQRNVSLFESLSALTRKRHDLVHQTELDSGFDDSDAVRAIDDIEVAIVRSYRRITDFYGWPFEQNWARGSSQ